MAILHNVPSRRLGRKDLLKIDRWHVAEGDCDIVCLIFPSVTVSHVRDWKVAKYRPKVPDKIEGG